MIKIKQAYYYIFYRLYLMFEMSFVVGDSDWKASSIMTMLELCIYFSFFGYYKALFNSDVSLPKSSPVFIIPLAAILLSKYYAFFRNEVWRDYIEKFERWSYEKHKRWGMWVLVYVIFVIINFFLMMYLLYKQSVALNKWH